MAPNDSAETTGEATSTVVGRRKAARYIVPVAVAGVAAATIGLVPALASTGDPDLPKISAQQLIENIAASDAEQLSGTFKISTDLGLPLDGIAGSLVPDGEGKDSRRGGPAGQAHGADVRHAHAAGGRRRPGAAEALHPRGRVRVQPHPQPGRGLGVRQQVRRGLPRRGSRGPGQPASSRRRPRRTARALRPPRRTSPSRRSRRPGTPPRSPWTARRGSPGGTRTSC